MFRLHHIGILVESIAEATANYTQMYGYQIKSDIFHDPRQTAFVRFVQLREDSSYVEFVSPDGPNSKLANAMQKGGGFNHLCYETDDIESACKRLEADGMFLIHAPVPAIAFSNRRVAWLMDDTRMLTELVEANPHGGL